MYGVISLTSSAKFLQQFGQHKQVLDSKTGPTGSHYQEGVRPLDVCPTGRQRTDAAFARHAEEHPLLAPAVGVAHQFKLLANQWVEWMSDEK